MLEPEPLDQPLPVAVHLDQPRPLDQPFPVAVLLDQPQPAVCSSLNDTSASVCGTCFAPSSSSSADVLLRFNLIHVVKNSNFSSEISLGASIVELKSHAAKLLFGG
jgi:hypothetical protein